MKIERPIQVDVLVLTVNQNSSEGKFGNVCCKKIRKNKNFKRSL